MKVNTTKELSIFLQLIEEYLKYLKPADNVVVLPEVKILKQGLDMQDIKNCLKYLSENNFVQVEVLYAPEVTPSKKGIIFASHTSVRTSEYNQVDYILDVDRKKINPLIIQAKKFLAKTNLSDKKYSRLIEKDGRGDYFYDGQKIEVTKETTYFKTFDILFSNADQDGFLSYGDIEKQLVKKNVQPSPSDTAKVKRINNVLINEQNGFFRFAKVNGKRLKNKAPDGDKLILAIRGEGVRLNNPKL
ncbi:MAG: hypothetical protein RL641_447 [Candidatus Parcubacteria bacterium]|jgi:hypothetical protein